MKKVRKGMNWFIIIAVIVLAVLPLLLNRGSEFSGADGVAEKAIQDMVPSYVPWVQPLLEPPGSETESLLFALQAAIGAGIIGYVIGFIKGKSIQRKEK